VCYIVVEETAVMPALSRVLTVAATALVFLVVSRLVWTAEAGDAASLTPHAYAYSRVALVLVLVAAAFVVPAWMSRRRMRRLLLSGDIGRILGTWQSSFRKVTYPETMTPLVTATAYAAYGFIDQARDALSRAAKGPAWDAAVEQRLFVEALLDVYEGDRSLAMAKAERLESLPLPDVSFWMRRKISLLRRGVTAFTRAFAHASRASDERLLQKAARSSPLVHWAMRYARAIVLVDAGRAGEARDLLADAPSWPAESAFRSFHDELVAQF
jgi:hypothetical protein